ISLFEELYRDLFGQESAFEAYRLLQGFDNKTLESGRALWRLSRKARASAPVRQILAEGDAAGVLAALDRSAQGRAFLAELRAYLEEYGQGLTTWELSSPSYWEEPTPVLTTLRDYLAQPDRGPEAERAALADARERSVAETRERLSGYPRQAVEQVEFLLK